MIKRIALALSLSALAPTAAHAFCGFYINGAGGDMFNNATQVVMMRAGTRTVLSMQNNYQGPPSDFAMVVPVPVVLHEGDVKTLPKEVFAKVDTMSAPRLVEYWEQDPCQPEVEEDRMMGMAGGAPPPTAVAESAPADYHVKIEAQFTVGEYDVVILSATESTGLDHYLRDQHYQIPKGAEPLLRPYVEAGSKFFVAKVDPKKVHFENGQAMLSPLRFHYDSEEFSLPIRLGLANSNGTQDLIVNILSDQRYEVANYKNVTIPTNFDVKPEVRKRFGEFYAALFDRTAAENPGAVVTEYSWDAGSCDPCPGPTLDGNDFQTLGADVAPTNGLVLTRLHARYGKEGAPNDLVFKVASPIFGGREERNEAGVLEHGASTSDTNNFQGRYAIRHEWTGPIRCASPQRGIWGGPPDGAGTDIASGPTAATNTAFAPRGKLELPNVVAQDIPEIHVKQGVPLPGGATGRVEGCGCESGKRRPDRAARRPRRAARRSTEKDMKKLALAVALLAPATTAHAFCGFYVAGGDQQMFNDATQVVLMRQGTRTVLSMQNNYKGPPQDFAMVIPVPVVLHEGDVKTLTKDVFQHVEAMGAPRLVEYWEQDPCAPQMEWGRARGAGAGFGAAPPAAKAAVQHHGVTIEAQFVVGEYQIVILSAKESAGLDDWLHEQSYNIPAGAEPLLRPYVEAGSKFFVARVDPKKVKFEVERAALSPLRFLYDSEEFTLPIRLGLANSSGTQDLIVNIFSPAQRYQVANYNNVTIPTNIDVDASIKDKFGSFYAALFDRTIEKNPGSVVTEYAWQATSCDPCPGPTLRPNELLTLGADVLGGTMAKPTAVETYDLVLTRLHARYGKDITDDLSFKQAPPIVGGREFVRDGGKLEEGAQPSSTNNFQGRYAIRHEWTGPIACENPQRHIWGGPPHGGSQRTTAAMDIAFAPRGDVKLPEVVKRDVPEIGIQSTYKADRHELGRARAGHAKATRRAARLPTAASQVRMRLRDE